MLTTATSEKEKTTTTTPHRSRQEPFFPPVKVQPQLTIGAIDDPYERQADAMADRVMRMPAQSQSAGSTFFPATSSHIQRSCAACDEKERILKKDNGGEGGVAVAPSIVNDVVSSGGQQLDAGARSFFEPRFGHDFSDVRIHTGGKASESSDAINAHAYTLNNNIVFNQGKYAPDTADDKRLLAHELTHVVQQRPSIMPQRRQQPARQLPRIYILHIDVNLTTMQLTITWNQSRAQSFEAIGAGAGVCGFNCNNVAQSNTEDSGCTPKLTNAPVLNTVRAHLPGYPKATFPTYFNMDRNIAIHTGKNLGSARSHGCVRTEETMAETIQRNSIRNVTTVTVQGNIPKKKKLWCYTNINERNPIIRPEPTRRDR